MRFNDPITIMLKTLILVGSGGAIGSILRYLAGTFITRQAGSLFPFGTFAINLTGCLVIGILAGLSEQRDLLSADTRLFLMIGLLGGFTTFSSFGLEAIQLIRGDEWLTALVYAVTSAVCGIALAGLGFWLGSLK